MAKDLTPSEIAAALQAMGMQIPDELNAKVENAVADTAEEKILSRFENPDAKDVTKAAENWRKDLFDLAASFANSFKGEQRNVGRGNRFVRVLEIETPNGTLVVKLSN